MRVSLFPICNLQVACKKMTHCKMQPLLCAHGGVPAAASTWPLGALWCITQVLLHVPGPQHPDMAAPASLGARKQGLLGGQRKWGLPGLRLLEVGGCEGSWVGTPDSWWWCDTWEGKRRDRLVVETVVVFSASEVANLFGP